MKQIKKYFLVPTVTIVALMGLWACEALIDDFEYDKKPSKLVVNAILNPDSVITIHISSSKTYNPPIEFKQIENANVELFENNQTMGQLSSKGNGYYTLPNQFPKTGNTYKVVVSAEGYESVWAETSIPNKIEGLKVTDKLQVAITKDGYSATRMNYSLSFLIPSEKSAYCGASISSQKLDLSYEYECVERETPIFNGYYYETDSCYFTDIDTLAAYTDYKYMYTKSSLIKFNKGWKEYNIAYFDEDYSTLKAYFSDQNYNGNTMSLDLGIDNHDLFNNLNNEITIWIDSFDEVLYQFMYSLAKTDEVEDDPFAEKVSVYSNVNGGLGIFGSSNSTGYTIQYDDEFLESSRPEY